MIVAAIPAFNEEVAIGSVILRTKEHVDEVIVVDDGSSDATAEIAELAGAWVVKHDRNMGKGAAIGTAFKRARELGADVLVLLDADGQHCPEDIPRVIQPVLNGEADMVVGSRFMEAKKYGPLYRRFGQAILTFMTNIGSRTKLSDSQSGFRAFSKKAIESLEFEEEGIGIESEMQMKGPSPDFKVMEVPITCSYDVEGSTYNPINHGIKVFTSIVRLISQEKPLTFFGIPGVLLILLGVTMGFWVTYKFSLTRTLAVGTVLVSVLVLLIGVFSAFTGIILHTIANWMTKLKRQGGG